MFKWLQLKQSKVLLKKTDAVTSLRVFSKNFPSDLQYYGEVVSVYMRKLSHKVVQYLPEIQSHDDDITHILSHLCEKDFCLCKQGPSCANDSHSQSWTQHVHIIWACFRVHPRPELISKEFCGSSTSYLYWTLNFENHWLIQSFRNDTI